MSEGTLDRGRFEAIEAYLLGTSTPAERERFEQELRADPTLRYELRVQRENMLAIELGGLKRTLEAVVQKETAVERRRAGTGWRTALKYAAVLTVLITGAVWWAMRPSVNERLFAQYHVADPGLPVPMSISDEPAFHDAMLAYKLGDHQEARDKWAPLLQARPTSDTLRFYIASAALDMEDTKAAIPLFEGLAAEPNSGFQAKAKWFLFLAYVRAGDNAKARAMKLEADPVYGERVRAIIAELP